MNSAAIKLDMLERLASVKDDTIIKQMAALLKKTFPEVMTGDADDDITDEELAELDRRRARRLSGESKGYTAGESIRMLRAAQAKDEAT